MEAYKEFKGKVGIVTGASSGIDRATAIYLGELAADLILADLDKPRLETIAQEIISAGGNEPLTVKTDISSEEDIKSLVSDGLDKFDTINFLVNSAGILRRTPFLDIESNEWDLMKNINLRGQYLLCREVLAHFVTKGKGVIANVVSLAGRSCSLLGGAHYTTAKHAMVGLSRHLAREFASQGIRVNAFCPGATRTPMIENLTSPEELNRLNAAIPRGTLADPMEHA